MKTPELETVREQHELAAKAAGLVLTWKECDPKGGPVCAPFVGVEPHLLPWRPLEDDREAFRLAVAVKLIANFSGEIFTAHECNSQTGWVPRLRAATVVSESASASARKAVFYAAVEIGRGM